MLIRRSFAALASSEVYDVAIVGAGMVGAAVAALLRSNAFTADMRIAIIDQQPPPMELTVSQYPDMRVSTITPANMQLLQQTGAWQELAQLAPTFQHMQVWEHAGSGFISWQASDIGHPHMGCVVENRLLQAALLRAAKAGSSSSSSSSEGCLDFICSGTVKALRLPGSGSQASVPPLAGSTTGGTTGSTAGSTTGGTGGSTGGSTSGSLAELQLADGSSLHCRLVVAADGARSRVREMAGLRTVGWSYNQRGLVASVATAEPSDTAWQRFLPTGPLALLPVRGGFSNVVWTVPPEMARQLEGLSSSQFADAVNDALQPDPATFSSSSSSSAGTPSAFRSGIAPLDAAAAAAASALQQLGGPLGGAVLGQLLNPGGALGFGGEAGQGSYWRRPPLVEGWVGSSPKSFPLQLQHSGRYVAPRLALVGDAAHSIHPMAGQGVNLGLGDAAALAETLAHARELGRDLGDLALLQSRYEAPRQRANMTMIAALEVLWRGFGVQAGLAGAARSAGLGLLNGVGPVKNRIMQYAMGLTQ
uniref:Ubiquinone biosynthesis monooxygenase COQ6, mitochondrial n=1 Tax=Tetradesmus obliquus TaxID=3088 RepID=A0A383VHV3_TETOB|eukprot:jgi/Sobl393_1/17027/SZX63946.1